MNAQIQPRIDKHSIYRRIKARSIDNANAEWLAQIVSSWCAGEGALPDYLGLEPVHFETLIARYFPACGIPKTALSGRCSDFKRMLEKDDLVKLLQAYVNPDIDDSEAMAIIAVIVAACLGDDHLWQDLGLWSRPALSELLRHNFPALAAKNIHDMKWKKFLYKQLCEAEGLYVCRAPSCEVCGDYQACFGPET